MKKRNTLLITLFSVLSLGLGGCSTSAQSSSSSSSSSASNKYGKYIQQYNQATDYLNKINNSNTETDARMSELQIFDKLQDMGIPTKIANKAFNDFQNGDDGGIDFDESAARDAEYYYQKIKPQYANVEINPYNISKYRQKIVNQIKTGLINDGYYGQQIPDALHRVVPFYFNGEDNTKL